MAPRGGYWNGEIGVKPPELFIHITPKVDACDHDFSGGVDLKDDQGPVCGFTTFCTKCGMAAMSYSLRATF